MFKEKAKSFLALLTVSAMMLTTTVASVSTVNAASTEDTVVASAVDLKTLEEQIENLASPVNGSYYEYYRSATLENGTYILMNVYNNLMMTNIAVGSKSLKNKKPSGYDTKNPDKMTSIDKTCEWTFTKQSNGTYYIQDCDGKYLYFDGGIKLSESSQEVTVTKQSSSNKNNYMFLLSANNYKLASYYDSYYSAFNVSTTNDYYNMSFYKKVTVNYNTTELYNAIKTAKHYMALHSDVAETLSTAVTYYNQVSEGNISQSVLDSITSELNSKTASYKSQYSGYDVQSVTDEINKIFSSSDYKMMTVDSQYSLSYLQTLAEKAYAVEVDEEAQYTVDKACDISAGTLKYDAEREFIPERIGDIKTYTQSLNIPWVGTNRQSTGIWATAYDKLYVYVDAEDDDPLPSILFTQHISDSQTKQEYKLEKGLNIIDVPYMYKNTWETSTEVGGCVYILNPYTEDEQSSNVKVYIDNGDKIPLFKKGDNKSKYYEELEEYYNNYTNGNENCHNVAEVVSDHFIMTVTLERAYEAYILNRINPDETVNNWDNFAHQMLEFGGLEQSQYENMGIHIKINQPYGGAYATNELIGIQANIWEATALRSTDLGWGFPHEFGHTIDSDYTDNGKRYVEVTNNMWSMEYVMSIDRPNDVCISKNIDSIAPDSKNDYWSSVYEGLYMFWDLELWHDGYWKELNTYYNTRTCGNSTVDSYRTYLSKEERIAVYSSKILGTDLTYYFEKWGFISDESDAYKNSIAALNLSTEKPKIWYLNYDSYFDVTSTNMNKGASVTVDNIISTSSSNTIAMSVPSNCSDAHLGYEIVRNGEIIGFTYNSEFVDKNANSSGNYTYTINAYDKALNKYASITISSSNYANKYVAQVNSQKYTSLSSAVAAANDGDTVYLLATTNITDTIKIENKSITIMPIDNKTYYIYNRSTTKKDIFYINNGQLTVSTPEGSSDNTLIIDGLKSSQYSAFSVWNNSSVKINKGVTIQNINNSSSGSAIYTSNSTVTLNGCIIRNNKVGTYGTICVESSTLNILNGTLIEHNVSSTAGSAIYVKNNSESVVSISDSVITKNISTNKDIMGTICAVGGKVILNDGTQIYDNVSDYYNSASAIYASSDAQVVFNGKLNITDNINLSSAASISPSASGTAVFKVEHSLGQIGFELLKSTDNSALTSNILNVVKYSNDEYSLSISNGNVVLAKVQTLKNTSTINTTSVTKGNSVKVTGKATGGTSPYTYAYYYKKSTASTWQNAGTGASAVIKPAYTGTYTVRVKVTDADGNETIKDFTVTVKAAALANTSTISAATITKGSSVKVTGKATGGTSPYTYTYYYKKSTASSWTSAGTGASATIKPSATGVYTVRVKVTDSKSTVARKDFTVTVKAALTNTSTISATSITKGNTVKVTGKATGGTSPYTYKYYYKKSTDSTWQDGGSGASTTIKPYYTGTYTVRVKVTDAKSTVARKDFTVTVKAPLANTSTISTTSITKGSTVKVTGKATGGTSPYKYAYYYKKSTDSTWQNAGTGASATIKPYYTGTYNIRVKVTDSKSTVVRKDFNVTVKAAALANTSTISATSITKGSTVKVTGKATGGTSPYTYAYYYKKSTASTWQNAGTGTSAAIKPAYTGTYTVRVKVTDAKGTTARKDFTVTVKAAALANTSTISSTYITKGNAVVVTGKATGGTSPYTYSYYYKKSTDSAWRNAGTGASVIIEPYYTGTYTVRVKVTDAKGTAVRKDFTVTVDKG